MSDSMDLDAALRSFDGFARVSQPEAPGMISLRAKTGTQGLAKAVKSVTGTGLPGQRAILHDGPRAAAWMSPDEWLLILPRADVTAALATLSAALAGRHHLAAEVSDARAMFRIDGALAADVLAKLTPADVAHLPAGEIRRSRLAQVAAAFWREGGGISVVTFRSVGDYAWGLLVNAAAPGGELGPARQDA
ncbi:MAG TPA: sarcosine oxidase subunit gamma family protein [Paracoccaceae bacterium]|nr:sarcosine oxidase subunit gamma family protein [Paracoccaceae bacterium]HMO73536.1 sarcosine oxidase subunit gamma family protein [Paracoccaceae bacterium]